MTVSARTRRNWGRIKTRTFGPRWFRVVTGPSYTYRAWFIRELPGSGAKAGLWMQLGDRMVCVYFFPE